METSFKREARIPPLPKLGEPVELQESEAPVAEAVNT
jgi:hypothetical protein